MRRRFALYSVPERIGKALQHAAESQCEVGSSTITLITAPIGAGMTAAIYQAESVHGYLLLEIHADASVWSVANALYRAVFNTESSLFGSGHMIDVSIRKLREGRHVGPIIVHNGDRLTAKTLDLLVDVGDSTGFSLVLCGSRRLRQLIMSAPPGSLLEKAKSRIDLDVDLPGPSLQDALLLGDELAEIKIGADLVEHLFKKSGTSVRALLSQFRAVEEVAAVLKLDRIGLHRWLELSGESETEQRKITAPRSSKIVVAGRSEVALNTAITGASRVA
jgi:hypothetical protein